MSEAVQLRVEEIDGTLGPPITGELPFPTAVGTSFALDDGRAAATSARKGGFVPAVGRVTRMIR